MMLCNTITYEKALFLDYANYTIELKIDGTRVLLDKGNLYNRDGQNITYKYPELKEDIEKLKDFVLDGELCVLNKDGLPDFNLLLKRNCEDKFKIKLQSKINPATLIVFDILKEGDRSYMNEPLYKRQERLKEILNSIKLEHIRFIQKFSTLEEGWNYVKRHNLEGLVLKDINSKYFMNLRSNYWLKLKNFKEDIMEFALYEVQPAGIVLKTQDNSIRITVNGQQATEVKQRIDTLGKVSVVVQYLDKTKEGKLRFPSFKSLFY